MFVDDGSVEAVPYQIDSIIMYKDGVKTYKGQIKNIINKKYFEINNMEVGGVKQISEKDILGFHTQPDNGIISHLFTNQYIDTIEEECNTIGNKCEKTSSLAKRNSVICSLKNGAGIKNKTDPIKICTECIKEPEGMDTNSLQHTDTETQGSSAPLNTTSFATSFATSAESAAYESLRQEACKPMLEEKENEMQAVQTQLAIATKPSRARELINRFNPFRKSKGGKKKSSTKKSRKKKTYKKKTHKKKTRKYRK